jgi:hypothetical protein
MQRSTCYSEAGVSVIGLVLKVDCVQSVHLYIHNHNWLYQYSSLVVCDMPTGKVTDVSEKIVACHLY